MRPYVVYWNNIPSPYMVERFNVLADRNSFEFEAWFNERTKSGRSWVVNEDSWRFRYRYLPVVSVFGRHIRIPTPILGRRPDVLVSLYAEPVFLAGWAIAKLRGVKTCFWCEITYDRWIERKGWKNKIKEITFSRVDATLGHGAEGQKFEIGRAHV